MVAFVIFALIALIMVVLLTAATKSNESNDNSNSKLSPSKEYYNSHTSASKIYQALETIKILQSTNKYDTFTSRLSFLCDLSKDISKYKSSKQYEEYVNMAIKRYKQAYKTDIITRRQKDFIRDPDIIPNHDFTAKLKARFFIDFCEAMQDEINKLKTEAAKQRRKDHVRDVAISIIQELKANNHIALANGIAEDAAQLGVTIDKASI